MKNFTDQNIGVQTPLGGLTIQNEQDGWTILQNSAADYLSFRFSFHFFSDLQQIAAYMQNEVQQIANSNDLAGDEGLQQLGNDSVMAVYYQYIDNTSHMVVIAAKLIAGRPGIFYIGVTKSEAMTGPCKQLFLDAAPAAMVQTGKKDAKTEKQLADHTLRYMHGYSSNTYGGGGTSTDKSFSLFKDGSFRYSYASVVSMGSLGGGSSRNEGFGIWQVQKDGQSPCLVLQWHLGNVGIYRLEWGEPGIILLDGERWLLDSL
ncbi:MAG: hypothetical protein ACT4OJ_08120 [Bacteroidota bacterium]